MKTALALLLAAAASTVSAQTIDQRIDAQLPSLVTMYKSLHQTPELSMKEEKTAAFVAARLRELGYEVSERVGQYETPGAVCHGVVAVMRNGKGPLILIRSDMDALPVAEQTGLPYASTNAGVMHACGHDIHMTTLIGAAKILADLRKEWHGTVMLVGQPAEEVVAGARAMLAGGLYARFGKPDFTIALHDIASLPAGKIGYTPGYAMASSDSVDVTMRGIGGHGAAPQNGKDPVVMAAEFITALQTISSRERSPLDPVIVTVGSIHGGTKRNIIPDEVKLNLTVRTYKAEVRARVLESIARIAKGVAIGAGVPDERMPLVEEVKAEHADATYNEPALTERLAGALKKSLGADNVLRVDPEMVSEDFSRFSLDNTIPSALLRLGATDPARLASGARVPGLHSSEFAPAPEPTLRTGIKAMVTMAMELMR
jgi:hippurate hydrolase